MMYSHKYNKSTRINSPRNCEKYVIRNGMFNLPISRNISYFCLFYILFIYSLSTILRTLVQILFYQNISCIYHYNINDNYNEYNKYTQDITINTIMSLYK